MARIRTIKPEAFASESLAEVSVHAERTFFGLLTQADDRGRFRDQPAVIAGLLWSLRPEHGPVGVEGDLTQLAGAGLICRYEGQDGKRYLHILTFAKHQKINRPSGIRHPGCPVHDAEQPSTEDAAQTRGALHESSQKDRGGLTAGSVSPHEAAHEGAVNDETAGQLTFSEPSVSPHGGNGEPSVSPHHPDLGPRNVDLGSPPSGGASAPAPESVSTQQLIGEYAASCAHRPPNGVLGHLGREVAKLLKEGIDPEHIRAGLARHRAKGLHPSTLPSLVHEAMNATSAPTGGLVRPESANTVRGHRAWANPADPATAYAEEL
ncbi:hypothetical protein [Streptomyces iranensis]|uniref:Phage or prophage related protein n=1 Tax=Streptomyces iranensis TaxID=576784 RepID=A0A061A4T4_9ACTN|nr:hypothetical protein [Streptomyces iranensis]MBP2059595.1 hypothetical protein [Streptomyces iranensis]CDR10470.1 predicted protein [Streptomyces iranensis]